MTTCLEHFESWSVNLQETMDEFLPMKIVVYCASDKPRISDQYKAPISKHQRALFNSEMTAYKQLINQVNHLNCTLR